MKSVNSMIWYANQPLGHNTLGSMMATISEKAGLSKRYTNHSLRSTTVHILDSNEFASRHITSVTGHKSETSLKTYTGYTAPSIKRKMSETIFETLCPKKNKDNVSDSNKENKPVNAVETDLDIENTELVPLSDSQYDTLVSDLRTEDLGFNVDMSHSQTETMQKISNASARNSTCTSTTNFKAQRLPMPVFHGCSNITVNFHYGSN